MIISKVKFSAEIYIDLGKMSVIFNLKEKILFIFGSRIDLIKKRNTSFHFSGAESI